jgi:hypothetical protein
VSAGDSILLSVVGHFARERNTHTNQERVSKMPIIKNVEVKSGNGSLLKGQEGNYETKEITLTLKKKGDFAKLKKGAMYSLVSGGKTYKSVFTGADTSSAYFKVAEEL